MMPSKFKFKNFPKKSTTGSKKHVNKSIFINMLRLEVMYPKMPKVRSKKAKIEQNDQYYLFLTIL